jgi:hypothetical protein
VPVALAPGRTFLGLLVLIGVVFALGRQAQPGEEASLRAPRAPEEAATPRLDTVRGRPPGRAPAGASVGRALSALRAKAIFRELNEGLDRAVGISDVAGIRSVSTPTGSVRRRSLQVARSLRAQGIVDLTEFESVAVRVLSAMPHAVIVRERRRARPCLETRRGEDVTRAPTEFIQVIRWRLQRQRREWLLHEASLVRDKVVDASNARCP